MNGTVVWFTGLPASGKTTLAQWVRERLVACGCAAVLLDGDELRGIITPRLGYGDADRMAFYTAIGKLAGLLARQGLTVLVSSTAPLRAHRKVARGFAPRFVEVWVRTALGACEHRDPKGLYQKARTGAIGDFPGITVPYEIPESPDFVAEDGLDGAAMAAIVRELTLPAAPPYARGSEDRGHPPAGAAP